jgi:hypothetical protein
VAERLRAFGSPVEERVYDAGHMGLMLALTPGSGRRGRLRDDIADFVRAQARPV